MRVCACVCACEHACMRASCECECVCVCILGPSRYTNVFDESKIKRIR